MPSVNRPRNASRPDYDADSPTPLPWSPAIDRLFFYNFSFRNSLLHFIVEVLIVIQSIFRRLSVCLALFCALLSTSELRAELYEIRGYLLGEQGDENAVDQYLSEALLPALKRQGIGPIGVFTNAENDTEDKTVFVVIPHEDPPAMAANRAHLVLDEQYQKDAAPFFARGNRNKAYQRNH